MKPIYAICLSLFLLPFSSAFGQDVIIFANGSDLEAKVIEVTSDKIRYKRIDNITGPTYSVRKGEVVAIEYANGTTDQFSQQEQPSYEPQRNAYESRSSDNRIENRYNASGGTLQAKGYRIYDKGRKLSSGEAKRILRTNSRALKRYKRGKSHKLRALGTAILAGGLAGAAIISWGIDTGGREAYYHHSCEFDGYRWVGCYRYRYVKDNKVDEALLTAGVGVIGLFSLGHFLIGKSKTKKAVRLYNNGYSLEAIPHQDNIQLGFVGGRSNGLSLTYRF